MEKTSMLYEFIFQMHVQIAKYLAKHWQPLSSSTRILFTSSTQSSPRESRKRELSGSEQYCVWVCSFNDAGLKYNLIFYFNIKFKT